MHIADAVVSMPVLVTGTLLGAGGVAIGLRQITPERMPETALVSTMFFVAALIHIPVGPTQLHLVLNGLAGLLLGWAVFPALLIALALQAVMFGYGGLTVLGLNTLVMALPGLIVHLLLRNAAQNAVSQGATFAVGALAGLTGILFSSLLLAAALLLSGKQYRSVTLAILAANGPLMIIEAVVTGFAVSFLKKTRPSMLNYERE